MKNFKRVALVFASVLVMGSLASCGGSDKPAETKAPEATTVAGGETTAAETPEVAGMEGWAAFADTVEITVPVYDRSKEGYPAVDNNYWTKWIQSEFGDKYNIKVTYVAIPRSDVMTKYSMLIAADQTPTILMEYDYPKVAQWANDGAMQAYDLDEFAQVAPTYYGKMVENNQLGYTAMNDETYFALSERPYYNTTFTHATFVRMDWLRQVGYDHVPVSYEEKMDAMQKIVDAGLSKNPLAGFLPTDAYVGNFAFRDFPVDEAEWAMHSSLGTASLIWEPTYKLLKRQNDEFNKGYWDPEYDLALRDTDVKADFINGEIYEFGGYMSPNVDWLTSFYEKNPGAELALASSYSTVEPGVVDNAQIRADNPFGMIVGFAHSASEDELKAAWMFMEWMVQEETLFTMENGIEGVTYTLDANGLPVVDGEYRGEEMLNHNANIDMTCIAHASKKIGTIEETITSIAPQGLPQDFTKALIDNYYELKEIADKGHAYSDPVFAVAIDAESEYSATLLSLYQEYSVGLTKADPAQFDALYEEYSQKYLDAGYQEIMDARLEAYNSGSSTKLPK